MKALSGWIALFLLAFIAALIYKLPARWVYEQGQPLLAERAAWSQRIAVVGLGGSLWQGHAAQLRFDERLLGRFSWTVTPLALLDGRVGLNWLLQQADGHLQGSAFTALDRSGELLQDVQGQFAANEVISFFPYLPLLLEGRIVVDLPEVAIKGQYLTHVQGTIRWQQAALTAPQAIALGDLLFTLQPQEEPAKPPAETSASGGTVVVAKQKKADLLVMGTLSNQGGEVAIEGSVQLFRRGKVESQIAIAPRQGASAAIQNSLALLGRRGRDGQYHLNWSGVLQ
ncbi:MAG: type II secretion system protein N [Gammaproteobacteria bacterium]|nr:type II secretion system protein N [Gammaproteobacteria bacterium]